MQSSALKYELPKATSVCFRERLSSQVPRICINEQKQPSSLTVNNIPLAPSAADPVHLNQHHARSEGHQKNFTQN